MTAEPVRNHRAHTGLVLSISDMLEFACFFHEKTGITHAENKLPLLRTQLTATLSRMGFSSMGEALRHLNSPKGSVDLQTVVNSLTINETYFYREEYQFDLLARSLLPEMTKTIRRGSKVRIWSLPCSTGEEPYSISIYLRENWPGFHIFDVDIFGSDIDTEVLKRALHAQYSQRALSRMPKPLHSRYFRPSACGSRFALNREIANSVTFNQVNLVERSMMASMMRMDVIFCRNLLIYLDDAARRIAVNNLHDCLKPGGCLLLGHSETMPWLASMFSVEREGGAVIYRKR